MNANEPNDFQATLQVFEKLSYCATGISAETQGAPATWEQMMASIAFSKLALVSTSILRLVPGSRVCSEVFGVQMWDLGSICGLSRNLAEVGLTMHYLLQSSISDSERMLRQQVWKHHELLERLKIMRTADPITQKLGAMEQLVDRQRVELNASVEFQKLSRDLRRRILQGERAKLLTNEEICASAGISPNFYAAMFKYGSNHTHSSPFSFSLMDRLSPSSGSGLDAINIALTICAGFLAVGIRDYIQLFPEQVNRLTTEERVQIQLWLGVVKWDRNSFFFRTF
jgi:Family of unknown function (DUF5677)